MRLGLSSFCFRYACRDARPPMDALTMMREAAAMGADLVQYCDNLPLHLLPQATIDALIALSRETGVAIEVGTRGLDLPVMERYVAIAQQAGSRAMRLVLGEKDLGVIASRLKEILPALREANIALAIENHGSVPSKTLAALVEEMQEPLIGFCVDTGNNMILLEHPMETVKALAPRALQLHIKDVILEPAPVGYRVTGRILGEGVLDIPALLQVFGERLGSLDTMIELWMDPAETLDETLIKEKAWISASLDAARGFLRAEGVAL